jgi:serine phosphatase RsbU (regulator of sigma subunit)
VLEEVVLGEATVTLAAGDLLVCYTDGVTEAIAADDEPFDVSRLVEVVLAQRAASAAAILDAITERLAQFTDRRAPFDDITLVVLKRT